MDYVKLEEICNITTGKHDANHGENGGDYRFYTCAIEPIKCPTYSFEGASIILPGNGANVGEVLYDDGKFEAYQRTYVLNSIKVSPRFVYYQLKGRWKKYICNKQYGSATNYIRYNNIAEFKIPLLSIEEQNKIVNLLDKADKIRAKKKLANDKLDEFLKSTFIFMFGDPVKNPKKHRETTIGEVCYFVKDGPHKSPNYQEIGIPFISVNNIISGKWNFDNIKYISKEDHETFKKRCHAERGDVLYTKGGTTGFAKYVDIDLDFSNWVHVAVLKFDKNIMNGRFFESMLNSDYCYKQSQQYTRGIANRDLVLGQMKMIRLYLPTIEEQNKYAQIVEKVEEQKQRNEKIIEQMDNLFNSLSQRAFKGEL